MRRLAPGARLARFGEWLRRAADLEHWAAFRLSFERLGGADRVGWPARDDAPATVCVLSGDVHHAYVAEAPSTGRCASRVYQLTCSPLHNYVPAFMKVAFRVFWSRIAERFVRVLLRPVAPVPRSPSVVRVTGPYFGNEIAEFVADGRRAVTTLQRSSSRSRAGRAARGRAHPPRRLTRAG